MRPENQSPLDHDGPIPLHEQIRSRLTAEIAEGRLNPGDRVPSDGQLSAFHGVSRITVRHALQQMATDGLLQRVVGKGTFVRTRTRAERVAFLSGFGENMRAVGRRPGYRTLDIATLPSSAVTAERLGLSIGAPVIFVRRLLLADDEPIALSQSSIPIDSLQGRGGALTMSALDGGSLYDLLEREAGLRFDRAIEEVNPVVAGRKLGKLLEIAPSALLLRVRRLVADPTGRPFEDAVIHYSANRYRFRLELHRGERST